MEERNSSCYTPLFRSYYGGIMTPESKEIPFIPLEAFKMEREEVINMIEKAFTLTFKEPPKDEVKKCNFSTLLLTYNRLDFGNEAMSWLYWRINRYILERASRVIFSKYGIEDCNGLGLSAISYNSSFFFLLEKEKERILTGDAVIPVRLFRPIGQIIHSSVDGFERIFKKLVITNDFSIDNLYSAVAAAKAELKEEIKEIEEREGIVKDTTTDHAYRLTERYDAKDEDIDRKEIALSFLDTLIPAFEDYLSDNPPQVPFLKRILLDALSDADWKIDAPCFITTKDAERIYSDKRLLRNEKYGIYMAEARPINTLKEVLGR